MVSGERRSRLQHMRRDDLISGGVQSGDRPPADGALRLVQDFVNTVDRENAVEALDGPDGLRAWLAHRGLPGAGDRLSDADIGRAVAVREALRALLVANNGHATTESDGLAGAAGVLTVAAARAR